VRVAVVGHVEWVEFVRVERVPLRGEVAHAHETWQQAGGGGAVAALQLAQIFGNVTLYTAVGDDELGRRTRAELEGRGITVHASTASAPNRRAYCLVDQTGERTITVLGEKLRPRGDDADLPWEQLARADAVYFVSGDVAALRQARRARVLVATTRELPTLRAADVELNAIVGSAEDDGERYRPGEIQPPPQLVVTTSGALGGWAQPGGPFQAAAPEAPVEDAYGCGDCFAAGLTAAIANGHELPDALAFAARCGAGALTGRGVHAAALSL
jgi:ribokinase